MIVRFSSAALPNRAELGGKAASLIRMTNAGLPVPGGAVLTTVFFAPWFEVIKASAMWAQLVESTPERWEPLCCALKDSVLRSEEHTSELQSLMRISYAVFCLKKKKTR